MENRHVLHLGVMVIVLKGGGKSFPAGENARINFLYRGRVSRRLHVPITTLYEEKRDGDTGTRKTPALFYLGLAEIMVRDGEWQFA